MIEIHGLTKSFGPKHVLRGIDLSVARGESLALLAQRYQVSLASIRSANSLRSDNIKVGDVLNIPAPSLAAQP